MSCGSHGKWTHPLLGVHANETIHIAHSPGTDRELLIEHRSELYIAHDIKLQHMAHEKKLNRQQLVMSADAEKGKKGMR
jgi:hypothetical protein